MILFPPFSQRNYKFFWEREWWICHGSVTGLACLHLKGATKSNMYHISSASSQTRGIVILPPADGGKEILKMVSYRITSKKKKKKNETGVNRARGKIVITPRKITLECLLKKLFYWIYNFRSIISIRRSWNNKMPKKIKEEEEWVGDEAGPAAGK